MALNRISFIKSVSTRFLLLCFSMSLACTVPVLWFASHQAEDILLADFTGRLERRRGNLERHFLDGGTSRLTEKIRDRIARGLTDDGMILLVDAQGRKLEGNLSRWPANIKDAQGWHPIKLHKDGEDHAQAYLVSVTQLSNGHKFLVSGLLDDREEVRIAMAQAFFAAFLLAMLLATIGSLIIRRHLNRMVQVVARTATNIADGNLSLRSPRNFTLDPLDCVAASLNRVLERIETLIEENRMMTDALAHDLRSPLTRICASLEQAGRISDEAGVGNDLHAIEQEVALMLRMIDDTLEISRAKAGIGREHFEYFDLAKVVRGLFDMYLPLAHVQEVKLTLDVEDALPVYANKGLMTRAIANLIDNAFKYGLSGKEIVLSASMSNGQVTVSVTDKGEGIPSERRDEALAKYRRLSQARSIPGMGLGLALVTAVAHLHNSSLTLDDNRPGLVVRLILPSS